MIFPAFYRSVINRRFPLVVLGSVVVECCHGDGNPSAAADVLRACHPPSLLSSVCATFLGRFYDSLKENEVKFNNVDIEKALMKSCKDAKGKENRFVSHLRDKIRHCCIVSC